MHPIISVCVITYNHAPYITACLDGIAAQATDAPFEVVICDDDSTDKTADIINDYLSRRDLPSFTLHRAPRNQGMMRNFLSALRRCRGDFIAFCEGDDLWSDPLKLQKQLSFMRQHPSCSLCLHPAYLLPPNTPPHAPSLSSFPAHINQPTPFSIHDILRITGQFAPSSSYMMRRDLLTAFPPWFEDAPVGDFFLEAYAMTIGDGWWLPDVMSTYRVFSAGSWSQVLHQNTTRQRAFAQQMLTCLDAMALDPAMIPLQPSYSLKRACLLTTLATACLLSKDYKAFKRAISDSVRDLPPWSITQAALYRLRHTPRLAARLYKAKLSLHHLKKRISR
jgi:glycosyltransferase involved in cell wall biosynthesis